VLKFVCKLFNMACYLSFSINGVRFDLVCYMYMVTCMQVTWSCRMPTTTRSTNTHLTASCVWASPSSPSHST